MPKDPPPAPPDAQSAAALDADLHGGRWRVHGRRAAVVIDGATIEVAYRRGAARRVWRAEALQPSEQGAQAHDPESGLRAELSWSAGAAGVHVRLALENGGAEPLALDEVSPLVVDAGGLLRVGEDASAWSVYRNGYQSWSGTRAYRVDEADRDPRWRFLRDTVTDVTRPAAGRRGVVRSDLVTAIVDRRSGSALAAGWLDASAYFGTIRVEAPGGRFRRLSADLDSAGRQLAAGERLELPELWIGAGGDGEALLALWADACGTAMHARIPDRVPVGWCSWYYYFTRVSEAAVLRNLEALQRLRPRIPCDYVMIDDGYQRAVGDWLEPNGKFPRGMRWLAAQIRAAGFDAGIWLAPFIVRPEARLFRDRPDWLVGGPRGRPRSAVWNPMWSLGRPAYALDTTHPEVLAWLRELARTLVQQWGYRVLKLDFLFAAALPGVRQDPGATRAQALRRGLEAIREGAGPDAFLLGCGCPLGPAVGVVDGMRIGADVAPFWTNWISRWLMRDRHGVATKHAVRNVLTRSFMHRRLWLNDPDCLMVRASETALTGDEVHSLAAVIALSDGMFVLSDDLEALPPERVALVEQALRLAGGRPRVCDLFERDLPELVRCHHPGGEIIGAFNFGARAAGRRVEIGDLPVAHARELWSGRDLRAVDGVIELPAVPRHGCRLLWLGRTEAEEGGPRPPADAGGGVDDRHQ